jgi:hypothetical protein
MGFGNYKKTYYVNVTEKEMESYHLLEGILLLIAMIVFFSCVIFGTLSLYP